MESLETIQENEENPEMRQYISDLMKTYDRRELAGAIQYNNLACKVSKMRNVFRSAIAAGGLSAIPVAYHSSKVIVLENYLQIVKDHPKLIDTASEIIIMSNIGGTGMAVMSGLLGCIGLAVRYNARNEVDKYSRGKELAQIRLSELEL